MQKQQLYRDDFSLSNSTEVSSELDEMRLRKRPFVPYRINEENLNKIDNLFSHGYQHELTASLPNSAIMSKFGFDQDSSLMLLSDSDDDDDDSEADDEDGDCDVSINSTLSSGTPSLSLSSAVENHSLAHSGYIKSSVKRTPSAMVASLSENSADRAFDFKVFSPTDSDRYLPSSPSRSIAAMFDGDEELPVLSRPSIASPPVRAMSSYFRLGGQILRHPHPDDNNSPSPVHRVDNIPSFKDDSSIYTGAHMYSHNASMPRQSVSVSSSTVKNDISRAAIHNTFKKSATVTNGSLHPKLSDLVHPFDDYKQPPATAPVGTSRNDSESKGSISDLLAHLDPLSSMNVNSNLNSFRPRMSPSTRNTKNTKVVEEESWISGDDDETIDRNEAAQSFFDEQTGETDAGFFNSHLNEPDSRMNPYVHRKLMRIRAEKLIDHSFTKKLFSKKASTSQVQDLINRMESVLRLMDKDDSGFVTWECFVRLILAVAPSHLLRADVLAFMSGGPILSLVI